jgi:hypothetical protein
MFESSTIMSFKDGFGAALISVTPPPCHPRA